MRPLIYIGILILISVTFFNCNKDDEFDAVKTYHGDVTFFTQDDLDKFGSQGYEIIEGQMILSSVSQVDNQITSLEKLFTIDRVHGDLIIDGNNSLTSLKGLEGISEITGGLTISNNPVLVHIGELHKVDTLNYLYIDNNASLENLDGLQGLQRIETFASIGRNSSLGSIEGLHNLEFIGETVEIYGNFKLQYLAGLEQVPSLENLTINQNYHLRNLDGFQGLQSVRGRLLVYSNTYLANIDGLSNIAHANEVIIYYNTILTDIDGLSGLTQAGSLNISYNSNLNNLNGLQQLEEVVASVEIRTNPNLFNACGIQSLLSGGFPENNFVFLENGYNPTYQEMVSGKCSK